MKTIYTVGRCGWSNTLALLRDVEQHRLHRKNIHRVIGTRAAISKFHSLMEVEMRRLVFRIMKRPDLLQKHVQTQVIPPDHSRSAALTELLGRQLH